MSRRLAVLSLLLTALPGQVALAATPPKLTITTPSLSPAATNQDYAEVFKGFEATGGTKGYTWVATGNLPKELALDKLTGKLSGAPATPGTYKFNVVVTDSSETPRTVTRPFTLAVVKGMEIAASELPKGFAGVKYVAKFAASGGSACCKWSSPGDSLPKGLTVDESSGVISGVPESDQTGTFKVTIVAKDASNPPLSARKVFPLAIGAGLEIVATEVPSAVAGKAYSEKLKATGGTPPYGWSVMPGSTPPAGMTFAQSDNDGLIAGKAPAGNYKVKVIVADSTTPAPQKKAATIELRVDSELAITTASLRNAVASTDYTESLVASGGLPLVPGRGEIPAESGGGSGESGGAPPVEPAGVQSYTWSLSEGSKLPSGFILSSDGHLSAKAPVAGTYQFKVKVTDRASPAQSAERDLSIAVEPKLKIATSSLPAAVALAAYSQTLTASNCISCVWTISRGALPAGLALARDTGAISGKPATLGDYPFTIEAQDSGSSQPAATTQLRLTVLAVLSGHIGFNVGAAPSVSAVIEATKAGESVTSVLTDEDHNYKMVVPAGDYTITAWATGFQKRSVTRNLSGTGETQDFMLDPGNHAGEFMRVIVGGEQTGASSTQSVRKIFSDLYIDTPGPAFFWRKNANLVYGNPLRFWGNVRLFSSPVTSAIALSDVNLPNLVKDLHVSELAQSAEFQLGTEYRIFGTPPASFLSTNGKPYHPVYVGRNNIDDHTTQKFTGSLYVGVGALTPVQPQESVTLVDAKVGDAATLYTKLTGKSAIEERYTALALLPEDRSRFLWEWSVGLRLKTHYFSPAGIPVDRPPAILDIGVGRNAVVTGGKLKGAVLRLEGFYPLPNAQLRMVYLFGGISARIGKSEAPGNYVLAPAPSDTAFPSAVVVNVVVPAPNRDIYRLGIGIDMVTLLQKLTKPTQ